MNRLLRILSLLTLFSLCTAANSTPLYSCAGCQARNSYPVPLMDSTLERSDLVEVNNQIKIGNFGIPLVVWFNCIEPATSPLQVSMDGQSVTAIMLSFTNSRGVVGWFTYRNNWNEANPPPIEQEGILFPALDDGCIHLGSVTTILSLRLGEKLGFYVMDVNVGFCWRLSCLCFERVLRVIRVIHKFLTRCYAVYF